jgi:hypothetical protein
MHRSAPSHRSSILRAAGCVAAVCTMSGRSLRRRSAQRLTRGTRCQYLWDLRRDRKSQKKGCPDRTFLNEQVMVGGRGSVRQLHHASLHWVHSTERPSDMRKSIFSSGLFSSRSSAVRAGYVCNGKTLVYQRTIVLKKLSGFLEISQYDSILLGSSRCCSVVLGQDRSHLDGAFVSLHSTSISHRTPVLRACRQPSKLCLASCSGSGRSTYA